MSKYILEFEQPLREIEDKIDSIKMMADDLRKTPDT